MPELIPESEAEHRLEIAGDIVTCCAKARRRQIIGDKEKARAALLVWKEMFFELELPRQHEEQDYTISLSYPEFLNIVDSVLGERVCVI